MEEMKETPHIYVADLAAYNAGFLRGKWIEADLAPQVILNKIRAMMKREGEFAIHDTANFHGLKIAEHEPLAMVSALATAIVKHGEAFAVYAAHMGHYGTALNTFKDRYLGEWGSPGDYAKWDCDEDLSARDLPDFILYNIDFERMGKDLLADKTWLNLSNGHIVVFSA